MSDISGAAVAEEQSPGRDYDLYVRLGTGFVLVLRDKGVRLDDRAIEYMHGRRWETRPFTDIVSVHVSSGNVPRMGVVGQSRIGFRDGTSLLVSSSSASGRPDPSKRHEYGGFVRDLHGKLVASGEARRIRFISGYSQARYTVLVVALGAAALLFVALPLILFFIVQKLELLGALVLGGTFVLPTWRVAQRNRPGSYDPHAPPDHLD